MNKVRNRITERKGKALNIYITASYPQIGSTIEVIKALDKSDVDLIEIGIPNSDPLADGIVIQKSSEVALRNGFNLKLLFEQLYEIKNEINTPLILMGYYNQILQYGVEKFLDSCVSIGIDTLILPDLPMNIYEKDYKSLFDSKGISMTFLVTPNTSEERIKKANLLSDSFIYIVSQTSITGNTTDINEEQINYYKKIKSMQLSNPALIGFGIHDKTTFNKACSYADGAIIGSAFIKELRKDVDGKIDDIVRQFINDLK